ncbi:MAG TPA: iron-sulfur cluster assembly accessory protein [Verrucomicrobiae bacterium]|nr:iron-sulfur cluster assembly accessory protein [candidate division Zixibacteria bacterium]HXF48065.1 iron-sulfur cluster assembly accessory protein [Verrucomicrobiae bacterium]
MVTLTPTAGEAVRGIIEQEKLPQTTALRLGVTTEGCEGSGTKFRYVLDFDATPAKENDSVFESEGMKILVDNDSLPHLSGLQLDARKQMGGVQFVFRNPQAKHSCGCGHSFSEEAPESH